MPIIITHLCACVSTMQRRIYAQINSLKMPGIEVVRIRRTKTLTGSPPGMQNGWQRKFIPTRVRLISFYYTSGSVLVIMC